jgi:hypothetical protein
MKLKIGMDYNRCKQMGRSKDERFELIMVIIMDTTGFCDVVMYSLLNFAIILE